MLKNLFNRLLSTPPAAPASGTPAATSGEAVSDAAAGSPPSPDDVTQADALIAEGNALEDVGQLTQAEALYRRAVDLAPGHARAHLNLGIVRAASGDWDGAVEAYRRVLQIDPGHAFGNYNYARLAFMRGDMPLAERLADAALRARPAFPQALVVQSEILDAQGRAEPAADALRAALRLQPDDAGAWFNLAVILQRERQPEQAEEALSHALELAPDNLAALELLCRTLRDQGFAAEALVPLQHASAVDSQAWALRSMELMTMNFVEGITAEALFNRHAEFGRDLEQAVPVRFHHEPEVGDPHRRLRVGYLSADFVLHPVAVFLAPVLEHHDRAQVEVFCYSLVEKPDHMTDRTRAAADQWRDVASLSQSELADLIHADRIDVLVDLMGHTGHPRLGVFCERPAAVQVAWLGYLNTTGLTRMDFRISDARCDPPEVSQRFHTERLVQMPASQWCYRAVSAQKVDPVPPFERHGYLTFGSFNAAFKVTPGACRRWAEVMLRVPHSRLMVVDIKTESKRAAIRREMASVGIAGDRIEFLPRMTLGEYLDLYNRVDMTFDSFPYGGGTTTFDSLWMGAPVVATLGETPVSRSAASILSALGLEDWVAPSVDGFVDLAVARATDLDALRSLRGTLRQRLQESLLTELPRYTRDLEAAYRRMWLEKAGPALSASRP